MSLKTLKMHEKQVKQKIWRNRDFSVYTRLNYVLVMFSIV